jgi:hypothetical protein
LAIAAYQRARQCAPDSAEPVLGLVRVLGDQPERGAALLRALSQTSQQWNVGRIRIALAKAVAEGAVDQAFDRLAELRAVAVVSRNEVERVARLALDHGRPWLAREALGSMEVSTHDPRLWLDVLLKLDDRSAAALLLQRVTPSQVGGTCELARLHELVGDHARAREVAGICVEQEPRNPVVGVLLRESGMESLAREVEARLRAAGAP